MALEFREGDHSYFLDNERVPNVTLITDTLANAYAGVPEDVLERARDRGTAVHLATQLYDEDALDEASLPDELRGYVAAWDRFRSETGFEPEAIEERVYSRRYRFAGTLDRRGKFMSLKSVRPRYHCLLDIKATATLMPMTGPQTAAYAAAYEEMSGDRIHRRFCVQLRDDGTYRLQEHDDPSDLSVFLAGATLENWRRRHGV